MAFQQLIFYHRKTVLSIEKIKKVTLNNFFFSSSFNGDKMLSRDAASEKSVTKVKGGKSNKQAEAILLLKVTEL